MTAYGSWPSPISAAAVANGGIGLGGPAVRPRDDGAVEIWWSELRPSEGGRVVLVRRIGDGEPTDAFEAPFSARTRVHEYGGGAWFVTADAVFFSNWDDQRLYRIDLEPDGTLGEPVAMTPEPEEPHAWRFADGRATPDGEWLVAVSEDHHEAVVADHGEALNAIVAVPAAGGEPLVLSDRTDFVSSPRVSPDGRWLSWICWNHPNMPWDGTRLLAAPLWQSTTELRIGNVKIVAGGEASLGGEQEAIVGADWSSDGRLLFSTDRSGYWNLTAWRPGDDDISVLTSLEGAEIGGPPWVFGLCQWTELDDGRLVAVVTKDATDSLAVVDSSGAVSSLETPFVAVSGLASVAGGSSVAAVGQLADALPCVASVAVPPADTSQDVSGPAVTVVRASADLGVEPEWFSAAEAIELSVGDRRSHAFFYAPTGPEAADSAELPPLVVMGHGGPTAHATPGLSLKVQFWTSRGFAVADVNYGGSTGFGRSYRRLLNDAWGIVDVEDCVAVAKHLAANGRVDPARMAIRGGSAGGLTVLRALQTSSEFSAGTSLYGVADLKALAADTHKFESRYLDGLIGPWPAGEAIYEERSPINYAADLSCPLLVMQGSEDEVVPPSQSEAIVAAVAEKGLPHAYLLFEGEQHGFRQAATIVRSLEAELWFYGKVFGFDPADEIEPLSEAVGFAR